MFAFLFGLIVGIGGFWIIVMERVRTMLYREKLASYMIMQEALAQLFQAASLLKSENRPSKNAVGFFEKADLQLLNAVAQGALVADKKILHLAGEICDYDHRQVKENFQEYLKALDRLEEVMRADLDVERLQRLTRFFAAVPPSEPVFKSLTPAKDQIWKALGSALEQNGNDKSSSA